MADDAPDWATQPGNDVPDWAAPSQSQSAPKPDLSWADVGKSALVNAPHSALDFGKSIVQPILHPIDTATSLKNIGQGVLEKTGIMSGEEHIPHANAVGQFFSDRYGGLENFKRTLAHDPVGFAADLSTVLTGGGGMAARVPGMAGRIGEVAGTVGRVVDPISAVGSAAKGVGKLGSGVIGNLGTGTGGESLRLAAQAGYEGGEQARAFRESMRGQMPIDEVVAEAKKGLTNIRNERGTAYRAGMAQIKDPTILSFNELDTALANVEKVKSFKGQSLSPSTEKIRQGMMKEVEDWKNLQASEFHTVEGFDALKQKLGDLRDATQYGTPERKVANEIYHAARNTIIAQAPEYAKVMKGYEEASKQIKEIEKTLSLTPNAPIDTSLRKLQSVLRNNVNANYGRRGELADYLVNAGAPRLMEKLAGQSLNTWTPRGLGKLGMQLASEIALLLAGSHVAGLAGVGMAAATLPMMSPRLMGEAAYLGGKGARLLPVRSAAQTGFQLGREQRAQGGRIKAPHPKHLGAKRAKDGNWYLNDPDRPGKYLKVSHARV